MQPTSGGGGLARFRSAPASWLESVLLKEEEEEEDPLSFTQLLSTIDDAPSHSQHQLYGAALSNKDKTPEIFMLEDSVPCRVRAKRGCATHPRSIAERVTHSLFSLYLTNSFTFCYLFSFRLRFAGLVSVTASESCKNLCQTWIRFFFSSFLSLSNSFIDHNSTLSISCGVGGL